jgi:hypothetical protein
MTDRSIRDLLGRADALTRAEQAIVRHALACPLAWPLPTDPLHAPALKLRPDGEPPQAAGAAWTATWQEASKSGAVWQVGSRARPAPGMHDANWRPLVGDGMAGVLDARKVLLNRYAARFSDSLQQATVDGGWCFGRGRVPAEIQGRSATLAATLAMFSRACGVPLAPDRVAMANVTPEEGGTLAGVDQEGLRGKLDALRQLCARPPVLLVSRDDLACVEEATASWPVAIRPRILSPHSVFELLLQEFPLAAPDPDPKQPRPVALTAALQDARQRWVRAALQEDAAERDRIYREEFAPEFAPLFASLDIVDTWGREAEGWDVLVSILGTSWQPAALLARRLKPRRMLLLGTDRSFAPVPGGHEPRALISRIGGVPLDELKHTEIAADDETTIYEQLRLFLAANQGARVVVDVTGGKKSMSSSGAMAAAALGLAVVYVDYLLYDPVARVPVPGSEYPRRLVTFVDWDQRGRVR